MLKSHKDLLMLRETRSESDSQCSESNALSIHLDAGRSRPSIISILLRRQQQ